MENKTVQNVVHGFKVFRPDWTCDPTGYNPKQYTCPGKFEEEGELDVCGHGMHFCQTAADCFNYYSFNSENKVAEVIQPMKQQAVISKCLMNLNVVSCGGAACQTAERKSSRQYQTLMLKYSSSVRVSG